MKKWLLSFLLAGFFGARAQTFEGTITWSMKYEITDAKTKADMEKGKKALSDPANQEKLKKMQEQMNTPEMKAMMDANPQLKSQMENAMKLLQGNSGGGDAMSALLPTGFIVQSKGSNSLVKMEGGMMPTEILTTTENGQPKSYRLDRAAKTFTAINVDTGMGIRRRRDTLQHTLTKTNETRVILGYSCTKYVVDMTERNTTIHQIFWNTTEIKGLDMKSLSKQRMGNSSQSFFYEGMAGIPLRMETTSPQISMVMEVTGIKKESVSSDNFVIPADFKESKGFMMGQ